MNTRNWPTGSPGSIVRAEYDAWREVSERIRQWEIMSKFKSNAGSHEQNCECDSHACMLFRTIRAWHKAAVKLEVIQELRWTGLLEAAKDQHNAIDTLWAMLIDRCEDADKIRRDFLPSKHWTFGVALKANEAIRKAEELFK